MAVIFVSYSRVDKPFTERFVARLRRMFPDVDVWYDDELHGGDVWWDEILNRIADCDVFIYLLSNESVQSPYCQAEFTEARRLQKRVVTVQIRDRTKLTDELDDIQYVDMKAGHDDPEALTRLGGAVRLQLSRATRKRPLWQPRTSKPRSSEEPARPSHAPDIDTPTLHDPAPAPVPDRQKPKRVYWAFGALIVMGAIIGIAALLFLNDDDGDRDPTPTTPAEEAALLGTESVSEKNSTPTETPEPVSDSTGATDIPAGSINADVWPEPTVQAFDGYEMVYVPAGCFMMGSSEGSGHEQPIHEVCLDAFWIDRTEVTNEQVGDSSGSGGANHPHENVTWYAAMNFCEGRGGRLPTEAEWEYAARGPEGLTYPWGYDFAEDYPVHSSNSDGGPADVGSRPEAASWVGALDMSGNVWEWVSDWYGEGYYATLEPVTRNPTGPAEGETKVLRGGSWNEDYFVVRSAYRNAANPNDSVSGYGFRCMRAP